jgi:hypothetical protein
MIDKSERRKLMRTLGGLLDLAEDSFNGANTAQVTKMSGDGWRAWVYTPAGPGSESIHIELLVGERWTAAEEGEAAA